MRKTHEWAPQPSAGYAPVRRLREVDAIPVHRPRRVRTRRRAGEPCCRGVVVVPAAGAAARHKRRAAVETCIPTRRLQFPKFFNEWRASKCDDRSIDLYLSGMEWPCALVYCWLTSSQWQCAIWIADDW